MKDSKWLADQVELLDVTLARGDDEINAEKEWSMSEPYVRTDSEETYVFYVIVNSGRESKKETNRKTEEPKWWT